MIEKRCVCGGELYVESPPFADMSDKDISDWKKAGGRVMVMCKDCGKEDSSTEGMRSRGEIELRLKAYKSAFCKDAMPEAYYDQLKAMIEDLEWVLDIKGGDNAEDKERSGDAAPGDGTGNRTAEGRPQNREEQKDAERGFNQTSGDGEENGGDEDPRAVVGARDIGGD